MTMARSRYNSGAAAALRRFAEDCRGVAAVEFALILPILVLLAIGCFEVPRFVLVFQKLARTASAVADLTAQADEPLTTNQMADIFTAGQITMQPYDVVASGRIYISSINNPSGSGVIMTWQKNNGGAVTTASKLGTEGGNPSGNLPAALLPASNEEVLAAEVYYNYTPVIKSIIYNGSQLYMIAYTRPRNHNLLTKP